MRLRTGDLGFAVLRVMVVLSVVISLPLPPAQASQLPARSGMGAALGDLYSVAMTDTIGSGFTNVNLGGLPTAIFTLAVGQWQSFTVTAQINSCTNLTDTVRASWSCGNDDGSGTASNPVNATADIAFLLEIPDISLSTTSLDFPYCQAGPTTAAITVTNSGAGPALNFALDSNLESSPFTVSNVSAGWSYTPASGVFAYTAGAIGGGSSVQGPEFFQLPSTAWWSTRRRWTAAMCWSTAPISPTPIAVSPTASPTARA